MAKDFLQDKFECIDLVLPPLIDGWATPRASVDGHGSGPRVKGQDALEWLGGWWVHGRGGILKHTRAILYQLHLLDR